MTGRTPAAVSSAAPAQAPAVPRERGRIVSIDALRGLALVILLLVNIAGIRRALPDQLNHPEWHGFTFADTFFPVFLFTMGAAMAFSSRAAAVLPMVRRVALLFAVGVGLALIRHGEFQLAGILQKIAVAYLLAWLVLRLPERAQAPVALAALLGAWAAFTWLSPGEVVAGSWEPETNLAAWLDRLVIGHPATEGFATAIMATLNVLGGVFVLRTIRRLDPPTALRRIVVWTVAGVALGLLFSLAVPVNKRIWTPSFTVLSHGVACAYLAAFWIVGETWGRGRAVLRPLTVLGRNPILIYVGFTILQHLLTPLREPLMADLAAAIGPLPASLAWSAVMLAVAVALAAALDRRRIYLKV